MGKPSIGDVEASSEKRDAKKEIKELTVLERNSKESIYHLIFEESKDIVKKDE